MIDRREFGGLAGGCAWMLASAVAAQGSAAPRRIGFLRFGTPTSSPGLLRALADLGYRDGHEVSIDWRWVASPEQAEAAAVDLVRNRVEVIIAGDTPVAHAAAKATRTIPIVLAGVADPLGSGLVASLARPGGNITGVSRNLPALAGKKLELLLQAAPGTTRFGFLGSAADPATGLFVDNSRDAGTRLGVEVLPWLVSGRAEFSAAFAAMQRERIQALVVQPLFAADYAVIAASAARHRWPSISDFRSFPEVGGLMSYGPSSTEQLERIAALVDRILRGARPADMPIEEPRRFHLAINLKTARALGLALAHSLRLRADELIE